MENFTFIIIQELGEFFGVSEKRIYTYIYSEICLKFKQPLNLLLT